MPLRVTRVLITVALAASASGCLSLRNDMLQAADVQRLTSDATSYLQGRFPAARTTLVLDYQQPTRRGSICAGEGEVYRDDCPASSSGSIEKMPLADAFKHSLSQAGFALAPPGTKDKTYHKVSCWAFVLDDGQVLLELKIDQGQASRLYSHDDRHALVAQSPFTVRL